MYNPTCSHHFAFSSCFFLTFIFRNPTMLLRQFSHYIVVLVLVFLFVQNNVLCTSALHADEQGKFDWSMQLLGNVEFTALPDEMSPEYMYVASTEGSIGIIGLREANGGDLLRRNFLPSSPKCIAATPKYLVVLTADGNVHYLDHKFLTPLFTVSLAINSTVLQGSCFAKGNTVTIGIVSKHDGAKIYKLNPEDDYYFAVPPIPDMPSLPNITGVLVMGPNGFFNNETHCHIYHLPSSTEIELREGQCEDATSTQYVFRSQRIGTRFIGGKQDFDPANTYTCDLCEFLFVRYPGRQPESPLCAHAYVLAKGLYIDFGTHRLHVANVHEGAKVLIAFADQETMKYHAVVKTRQGNLMMVTHDGTILWERPESLSFPAAVTMVDNPDDMDHFHFNKNALIATRTGSLYSIPVNNRGAVVQLVADLSDDLPEALGTFDMEDVTIEDLQEDFRGHARMLATHKNNKAIVQIDLLNNEIHIEVQPWDNFIITPHFSVSKGLQVSPPLKEAEEMSVFTVNQTSGQLHGYSVKGSAVIPTWSVQIPSELVAYALPEAHQLNYRSNIRLYPNKTKEETVYEVRHRFPLHNIVAVAHYEKEGSESLSTLVVTVVDTITGAIHGTVRHHNVEGKVKMIIVENAIAYYYLDAKKMRYCFGVWELFRVEEGDVVTKDSGVSPPSAIASLFEKHDAVFSSRATLPPVVKVQSLGMYGGPVAVLGVTTSFESYAKKNIVLVFETGRVALLELNRLMRGRPIFFNKEPQEMMDMRDLTQILIPPTSYATHRYRLAKPQHLIITPTGLESSNHIMVAGQDLFYVRYSSGKAFDLLNSDFDKRLLLALLCGLCAITAMVRHFVKRKSLSVMWS